MSFLKKLLGGNQKEDPFPIDYIAGEEATVLEALRNEFHQVLVLVKEIHRQDVYRREGSDYFTKEAFTVLVGPVRLIRDLANRGKTIAENKNNKVKFKDIASAATILLENVSELVSLSQRFELMGKFHWTGMTEAGMLKTDFSPDLLPKDRKRLLDDHAKVRRLQDVIRVQTKMIASILEVRIDIRGF